MGKDKIEKLEKQVEKLKLSNIKKDREITELRIKIDKLRDYVSKYL